MVVLGEEPLVENFHSHLNLCGIIFQMHFKYLTESALA